MDSDLINFDDNCENSQFEKCNISSILNRNIDSNCNISCLLSDNFPSGRESLGLLDNNFIEKQLFWDTAFNNNLGQLSHLSSEFDLLNSDVKYSFPNGSLSKIYSISTNTNILEQAFLVPNLNPPTLRPRIKSLPSDLMRTKQILQPVEEAVSEPKPEIVSITS